jgi:hypothetical protein
MIFVPDLHITTKYANRIIDQIDKYIASYPQETDIIFLWDYVYAFSYDRKALLSLFEWWIRLHHQGKNLYILAWNHDRIWDQFVYEQAKQSRDIINRYSDHHIYFITRPQIHQIQGQTIFFLPYVIDPATLTIDTYDISIDIDPQTKPTGKQMSSYLNDFVWQVLHKIWPCTMIHHYYVAQTQFWPWSGMFSLNDVALQPQWIDYPGLKMISGHIHHPFVYHNYLCLGSARHTSDREYNQIKILAHYDTQNMHTDLHTHWINPIVHIDMDLHPDVNTQVIDHHCQDLIHHHYLQSNHHRDIDYHFDLPAYSDLKVQCYTNLTFADAKQHIAWPLRNLCHHIDIKKHSHQVSALIQDLQVQHKKLQMSLTEWKMICKQYIEHRYPQDHQTYLQILQDLRILW